MKKSTSPDGLYSTIGIAGVKRPLKLRTFAATDFFYILVRRIISVPVQHLKNCILSALDEKSQTLNMHWAKGTKKI